MRKFVALFFASVAARELKDDFARWTGRFDKKYESSEEHVRRMNVWAENLAVVNAHNAEAAAGKHTFALKMNKFADMTSEEYQKTVLGYRPSTVRSKEIFKAAVSSAPPSWDWRPQGVVTPVKDQAQCGSCWAFSAVAAMEGTFNIKNNGTMPGKCSTMCGPGKTPCCAFSEQELVDCTDDGADTCNKGGDPRQGILEIAKHMQGTANTEEQYPYTSAAGKTTGKCSAIADGVQTGITGAVSIPEGDEAALKAASHETVSPSVSMRRRPAFSSTATACTCSPNAVQPSLIMASPSLAMALSRALRPDLRLHHRLDLRLHQLHHRQVPALPLVLGTASITVRSQHVWRRMDATGALALVVGARTRHA
jgi:cathepsin L